MARQKIKIKLTRERIIFAAIALLVFLAIYFAYPTLYKLLPVTTVNYHGHLLQFRADLREASKVAVYPNESSIKSIFYNPAIKTVYICFRNTTQNSLVAVEAWEISYKLKTFYLLAGLPVDFKGQEVSSYSQEGNSTSPVIVLIPPVDANETAVRAGNYAVYISGKDMHGFDLATEKFLMVVLGIKVN